jgi:dihydrodipicolinate synthase/N-acetylneuraminate lyase
MSSPGSGGQAVRVARAELVRRLFRGGVPLLWCPPVTHYDDAGAIDAARMAAHLRHLAPHAHGLLIPGSTGDGWELTAQEVRQLLELALVQAQQLDLRLLIGALRPDPQEALRFIRESVDWLKARTKKPTALEALDEARVCGFTVCPPRGAELSQHQIAGALASVLELGLPTAIYQLPQVTQNEISPEAALDLARSFSNFVFFKDTSGADHVALEGRGLAGVFATRGAEGDYARWLKNAGGPYDGFLLGSANCFASQFHRLIDDVSAGREEPARQLSDRLTGVVNEASSLVAGLSVGNAFANANKAMDHFFAHGPQAGNVPPPRLHAGGRLPVEVIRAAGELLRRYGLMPAKGYLE